MASAAGVPIGVWMETFGNDEIQHLFLAMGRGQMSGSTECEIADYMLRSGVPALGRKIGAA